MATKTKKKPKPEPKIEPFSTSLRVPLSADEIAERADRAAQMIGDRDSKEEEHKATAKHNKSIIEGLEAEIRRLSNEVRTKATYKPVECERRYDYGTGLLKEVRLDTGELVMERSLTAEEMQPELPFKENGEEGGGPLSA